MKKLNPAVVSFQTGISISNSLIVLAYVKFRLMQNVQEVLAILYSEYTPKIGQDILYTQYISDIRPVNLTGI